MNSNPPPQDDQLQKNLLLIKKQSSNIDAVYLPLDSYIISNADMIGTQLNASKIFSIGAQKEYIKKGVFIGTVPSYYNLGEQAAMLIDRHQKGEHLGNIPIQHVKKPQIIINKKTQKILNIKIPVDLFKKTIFIEN